MLPQTYEIIIYNNEIAVVEKIDNDIYIYNHFKDTFESVYHTKNGNIYQLHEIFDACINMLIVDDNHLYELLDDLKEQGFCENIEFSWIDGYSYESYKAF